MGNLEASSDIDTPIVERENVLKRGIKFIGHNALKGLFWGLGFSAVAAPLGYIGLERLEQSTSELKSSVDQFNRTVGDGSQIIGARLGDLDSTARSIVPTTSTTQPSPTPVYEAGPPTTLDQLPSGEEQARGPIEAPTTTTSTTVAGQP